MGFAINVVGNVRTLFENMSAIANSHGVYTAKNNVHNTITVQTPRISAACGMRWNNEIVERCEEPFRTEFRIAEKSTC
jgi:hypothetical protein